MDEMSHRVEQTFDALQRWFGPNWTYIQMALWIEARASSSHMPRWAIVWAGDFLRIRRQQEAVMKGESDE